MLNLASNTCKFILLSLIFSLLSSSAALAEKCTYWCEQKDDRESVVGTWRLSSIHNYQDKEVKLRPGGLLRVEECGSKLCAFPIVDGRCEKNAIVPYDRPVNEQRARVYVLKLSGLPEPYYVNLFLRDPDDKERPRMLLMLGASFSFYKEHNTVARGEAGLAFETKWEYVDNSRCKR